MPEIIGITGGIGSGKSRVCAYLAELSGWPCIDLDQICRQLLMPQAAGWLALKKFLSADFFTASDELDRRRLRKAIFADPALRRQIDSIIHPLAKEEVTVQAAATGAPLVLAEIPLLFEAGWQDSVSQIVVVYADEAVRLQRIMERDQVTETEARQTVAAQMPLAEKAELADYTLDNSGDWQKTCGHVRQFAAALREEKIFFSKKS